MFLTEEKLKQRIEELKEYRYRDLMHLDEFLVRRDEEKVVNPVIPQPSKDWSRMYLNDIWAGRDEYLWMHKEIEIPVFYRGRKIVGIFDFGKTGEGTNSGFESMCYLNGKMYQGVDSNHKEVLLKKEHAYGKLCMDFRLWSGLEGGGEPAIQEHRIKRADIGWLDEKTDDLYYLGKMVLETIKVLADTDAVKYQLLKALDKAFAWVDWSYPGSALFYESVYEADDILNDRIDKMKKETLVTVNCVGHTHIDAAWLWRLKHTKEKCSRSFSTVLRLMEEYPEYKFLQSQPQLYAYMKDEYPDLYEEIKEKIRNGQWECDGGMWIEADCNLVSGESLTRQILLGTRFFKEEFGKEAEYLWLPDVFGYSWALPQILKKFGIDMFMTTKISWNQYNRMPHDTFWWKGMDGSQVLTHFITAPEPGRDKDSWFYTYNGMMEPLVAKGIWDAYKEKEANKELLLAYGYGDGGGGVNRDMLEQRRRIDKIPGMPNLRTAAAGEFFRKLKNTFQNTDSYVHTWDGELYLEYHRGTYTSQAYNKKMNRKMELLYRRAEWLTVMEGLSKNDLSLARQEELTQGWKLILLNQFHDIIPGSSIHEVYKESREQYKTVEKIGREIVDGFYQAAVDKSKGGYTIMNSSPWYRGGIIPVEEGGYEDEAGTVLPLQKSKDKCYVKVDQIPPMGFAVIKRTGKINSKEEKIPFCADGRRIETPYYDVLFNKAGQIESLYDRRNQREVGMKGQCLNELLMFEDKPLGNDAWDIDLFYQEKRKTITDLQEFEIEEQGSLQLTVNLKWKYMSSQICQKVIFYSYSPRIDFKTIVDFHEQHQLLKAAFPVDIRSTYATYDIQYGNVRRPTHWNTSWDQARFESVGHRFADLSEREYGVSVLNDCKYGYDIKDQTIRLTLLKSATNPDYLQDQGRHEFIYSLLPHKGDFVEGRTVQEAFDLNEPLEGVKGMLKLPPTSFVSFDTQHIEIDAIKKSEDGNYLVLRFHEFTGSRKQVTVSPGFSFKSWAEGDLRENPLEAAHYEKSIVLSMKPYEIKTLLFAMA